MKKVLSKKHKKAISEGCKRFWKTFDSTDRDRKLSIALTGKHLTDETKEKLRVFNLGKKLTKKAKQKISKALKGHRFWGERHHSKEVRIKMGEAHKGYRHTKEAKEKMSEALRGRPLSEEHKRKLSESHKGLIESRSPRWIKDRSLLKKRQERNDVAYREWSKNVKKRDGWKCRVNNKNCFGKVIAHHILGWSGFPELRYKTNNGITLCQAHHPRKRAEEKRLIPYFQGLMSVSNEKI